MKASMQASQASLQRLKLFEQAQCNLANESGSGLDWVIYTSPDLLQHALSMTVRLPMGDNLSSTDVTTRKELLKGIIRVLKKVFEQEYDTIKSDCMTVTQQSETYAMHRITFKELDHIAKLANLYEHLTANYTHGTPEKRKPENQTIGL